MERTSRSQRELPPALLVIGGVTLALGLTLAIFLTIAQPPMRDLVALAGILAIAAVVSIGIGYLAFRLGWMDRLPTLRWMLLGGYAVSNLLAFISVWVTALLMFVNEHDLALATVLLLFAGGIALSLGYLLSVYLTRRITDLNEAAQRIAEGQLEVRVPVRGRDELAELAESFNQMATQLEAAEEQQRQLNALRRELVTWVGHDLRTPLTSIRVVVEALSDGVVEDPATIERYLHSAQHHIRSLSRLLDDLFDVAQIEGGGIRVERYPSSIRDLISDTIEAFSTLAKHQGVRLEGGVDPAVDPVLMDVPKIERVLANLIDNALRHTPAGGVVHVGASATPAGVRVQVRDTGSGIRDEDLPRVFDRFYRGDGGRVVNADSRSARGRAASGAGLGLAIAKGIVEAHGGDIGIDSTVGEGTEVWFTLPR